MQCLLSRLISSLQNRNELVYFASHVLAESEGERGLQILVELTCCVILTFIALGDKISPTSVYNSKAARTPNGHNWLANKNTQTITSIKEVEKEAGEEEG